MFFCRQSGVYPDVNLHSDIPVCASAEAKKVFSIPSSCQLISEQRYKYFLHFSAKLLNSNPLVGVKWVSWKPTFLTSFDDLHPWFPVRRIIRKRRALQSVAAWRLLVSWRLGQIVADLVFEHGLWMLSRCLKVLDPEVKPLDLGELCGQSWVWMYGSGLAGLSKCFYLRAD